jgi:heme O synthase-like polyprenyltransferase
MFENRTEKQQIVIYAIIAFIVAFILSIFHYYTYTGIFANIYVIILFANIEFFAIFYILYLPIKVKKAREKQEKNKKTK